MPDSKTGRKLIAAFLAMMAVTGCVGSRQLRALLRSADSFLRYAEDRRVLYEPGAEVLAARVAAMLPACIRLVEARQMSPFLEPVRVYVCASESSFVAHFGLRARAGVLRRLYLSPRIFDDGDRVARMYLAHELSHLNLLQHLGFWRMQMLPFWFTEGLATYVSLGGGAHRVTDEEAIDGLRGVHHFVPGAYGGPFHRQTPRSFGLDPHLFYRQSMLFVRFLAEPNPACFRKLMRLLESGSPFSLAVYRAYGRPVSGLWNAFLLQIAASGR